MTGTSKKLIKLHSTFYSGTKLGSPPPPSKHLDNKLGALQLTSTLGTPLSLSTFSGQAQIAQHGTQFPRQHSPMAKAYLQAMTGGAHHL
jgi:hypothetical protein